MSHAFKPHMEAIIHDGGIYIDFLYVNSQEEAVDMLHELQKVLADQGVELTPKWPGDMKEASGISICG